MMKFVHKSIALATLCLLFSTAAAHAVAPRDNTLALGQALSGGTSEVLFARDPHYGFSLSSSNFSGRSSGMQSNEDHGVSALGMVTAKHDKFAELEGDQRVYAFLLDGKYDFSNDLGTGLPLHPYIGAGVGVALYEAGAGNNNLSQEGAMVPLFRLGGGVVVKLGTDWDLSLNYKAGYTGSAPSGSVFTGRQQETVNLQSLDMGLKLKF